MIQIIETDQWSACGDEAHDDGRELIPFDLLQFVRGFRLREVGESAQPLKGYVWFIKDETTGKPKIWKTNYDSSD